MTTDRHATAAYDEYSQLTGPFVEVPAGPYEVSYRRLTSGRRQRVQTVVLSSCALLFETAFLLWLLQPAHWPTGRAGDWTRWVSLALVCSSALIEIMRLVNLTTLCLATLQARDPVPVRPEPGLRVAFLTTIVPSKEPLSLARATLEAALRMRHDGVLDVWLLDEGDDRQVRRMCDRLGVRHFTRKGVGQWNQASGSFKAKTKHGNYNAWLQAHGDDYDAWVSVDTDHVPLPNFAERLLGYLRDPDVAFVVGPQVYGNDDSFISRAAESQQYMFHAVIQRAGNRHDAAMFVGTNNAVRIRALQAIGGLQDSITEDAATSLVWHSSRNPETGRRWKSVYTPDVLAVGEGPSSWTDYFTQQYRWSRGNNEVLVRRFWHLAKGLSAGRRLHSTLLLSYYPTAALAWVLGFVNLATYLLTGLGGVRVAEATWFTFYVNAAVLQLGIFLWNRRHNVSPHEESGSSGLSGMFVSVLSAPLYVTALLDSLLGRTTAFVVTPKGASGSPDRVRTFGKGIGWGLALVAVLAASVPLHHDRPGMRIWAVSGVLTCLLPLILWLLGRRTTITRPVPDVPPELVPQQPLDQHSSPTKSVPVHYQEISS